MKRLNSVLGIGLLGVMMGIASMSMAACGDDDDDAAGSGGGSGKGGSSGTGGTSGGGGSSGTGGGGGSAGAGGGSGSAGAGGGAGSAGAGGQGGGGRTEKFVLPGDNATKVCTKAGGTAFEKYGPLFPTAANLIVDNTVADIEKNKSNVPEKLGTAFNNSTPQSLEALKTSLGNFLTAAYGGPVATYTGQTMFKAHTGMGISQTNYDYFLTNIIVATASAVVPQEDIESCFAPVLTDPKLVNDIVEKPND